MQVDQVNGFIFETDKDATSPNIQRAIWKGQHRTVDDSNWLDHPIASDNAGRAIVKHQLSGNKGHYSVLCFGFVKFECLGFPHSVHDQIVRHRDSSFNNLAFLVTSNRYTGDRFIEVAEGKKPVEEVFFHRQPGEYRDREGAKFVVTENERVGYFEDCLRSCENYRYMVVDKGYSKEVARDRLKFGFRQNFTIAGTVEAIWHLLDQRLKKDSQLEAQMYATMLEQELFFLMPELQDWYRQNRYGKAILAP